MRKYGYVVLAAIAAVLVSLGLSTSAQAYPDARIDLTVNHLVLNSGQSLRAIGTTNVACALDLEWDHVVRQSGTTKTFAASYIAPEVTKITTIPLTGSCRVAGGAGTSATSVRRKLDVTVLPATNGAPGPADQGADLTDAGGPSLVVLLSGLVLLLAGATSVTVARRRAEDVEDPGQTA
jgi:hypothetical protein